MPRIASSRTRNAYYKVGGRRAGEEGNDSQIQRPIWGSCLAPSFRDRLEHVFVTQMSQDQRRYVVRVPPEVQEHAVCQVAIHVATEERGPDHEWQGPQRTNREQHAEAYGG